MSDRTPHTALISQVSGAYDLPFALLEAQVLQESGGDAYAFRYEAGYFERYIRHKPETKGFRYGPLAACSYGLLQVVLETVIEVGFEGKPEELFKPHVGLTWGAKVMRELLLWSQGDYRAALAAFNGGRAGNRVPPYRNQSYVTAVYGRLDA